VRKTDLASLIIVAVVGVCLIGLALTRQPDPNRLSRTEMLNLVRALPIDGAAEVTGARCEYVAKSRTVLGCGYFLPIPPDQLAPALLAQGWTYVGETTSPLAIVSQREFQFRRSDLSIRLSTNETGKLITRLSIIQTH
jgi:hypothetical protein